MVTGSVVGKAMMRCIIGDKQPWTLRWWMYVMLSSEDNRFVAEKDAGCQMLENRP
jgi:hypothetical protein